MCFADSDIDHDYSMAEDVVNHTNAVLPDSLTFKKIRVLETSNLKALKRSKMACGLYATCLISLLSAVSLVLQMRNGI